MTATSGQRVLVVDDEPAIRGLVQKIVERAGLDVDVAVDGADAIRKLSAGDYAVLVLDLMMPSVDGYSVIDAVRDLHGRRPAIIVITAADSSAIRQLDGTLVHSVLRKPFDIDVLQDLVQAAAKSVATADVLPFPRRESEPAS